MKKLIIALLFMVGFMAAGVALSSSGVMAIDPFDQCSAQNSDSSICSSTDDNVNDLIGTIVNTMLLIVGILAVIVIIIGGIMFVTSAGNQQAVTNAKNAVLYSVIGLVVAFLAYAIVNWVFNIF